MKLKTCFLLWMLWATVAVAQVLPTYHLNIGDPAPAIKVKHWIKGTPVTAFEKEKIYVIDFWATWCVPCKITMPHTSKLAEKYKDKATFLAIDVYEKEDVPIADIKKLVDTMGDKMNFHVGIEEGKFMSKNWLDTSGTYGIPTIFIVNDGRLDWIGHPKYLDSVLTKILNKTWSPELARIKLTDQRYLRQLNSVAIAEFLRRTDRMVVDIPGNTYKRVRTTPDSILMILDEMVKHIPTLKYYGNFASFRFSALLETDQRRAIDFAREVLAYEQEDPSYLIFTASIEEEFDKLDMQEDIYRFGAACYQAWIDENPYPEYGNVPVKYKKMALMYRRAGDIEKAEEADRKAAGELL
ncbi:TlpA family protein disulfide reductase [Pedobacter faecalis]|uniref:TlpA family protein disulfide reductase n=1 Tax=Pedobacter faecalis TaxID=3041495 RepID=UPI00254F33FD|nr:TlpA disulfide reductase family protein [Pedobacter sp. ELA7]